MIISRTPYRISFFGGGTDYPAWYLKNGGAVLSSTIDKYQYITCRKLPNIFDYKYRVRYFYREETSCINDIKHPSVRETIKFLKLTDPLDISHFGDLPAKSGMGSSSSFTVGLLAALSGLRGELTTKRKLATNAIHIEQNLIGESVGSQDQIAAAFGGFNKISFDTSGNYQVAPIIIPKNNIELFESHLLLIYTGIPRFSGDIASQKIKNIPVKHNELTEMMGMVDSALSEFYSENFSPMRIGKLLNEQWKIKKELASNVTNSDVNYLYQLCLDSGAVGGKLLGAGGGGFLLLLAEPSLHQNITEAVKPFNSVPFKFETSGSQVVYHKYDE